MVESRKRVLLVDDDEAVLFVLREALHELGDEYEIVATWSGLEALEQAKKAPCELLITDLVMSDLDGVQLTEYVKAHWPETVVVWITAHGCDRVREEAARLAVSCCLDKPLEIYEILKVVKKALESLRNRNQADTRARAEANC